MQITIVTFKGYNEQDRLVAAGILNRMRRQRPEGVRHHTVGSGQSMNGIIIHLFILRAPLNCSIVNAD